LVVSRERWIHRHPSLALLLLVASALAVSALVAELGGRVFLRSWGPTVGGERTAFARYDSLLGWAHLPGAQERFTRREFSTDVRISSDGHRDREYPHERSAKKRVLVLGDSFGWGYGVELDERFDELLERAHPDWEIINASVSGYGTDQQLLYLREAGAEYRPDVVLLLFYLNDFTNNRASAQYYTNKPYFLSSDSGGLDLRNVPVPPPSVSQRLARWIGGTYVWGRALQGATGVLQRIRADGTASPAEPTVTLRLLREVDRTTRELGARFALVSVPMRDDARKDALRREAAESGFSFLSLDSAFAAAGTGLTFPENGHWTAHGHAVAADAMEGLLLEALHAASSSTSGTDRRIGAAPPP
jgi:hypothetical protein